MKIGLLRQTVDKRKSLADFVKKNFVAGFKDRYFHRVNRY